MQWSDVKVSLEYACMNICVCLHLFRKEFCFVIHCLVPCSVGLCPSTGNFCTPSRKMCGRIHTGYNPSSEPTGSVLGTQLWTMNKNCPKRARLAFPSRGHMEARNPAAVNSRVSGLYLQTSARRHFLSLGLTSEKERGKGLQIAILETGVKKPCRAVTCY